MFLVVQCEIFSRHREIASKSYALGLLTLLAVTHHGVSEAFNRITNCAAQAAAGQLGFTHCFNPGELGEMSWWSGNYLAYTGKFVATAMGV